MVLKQIPKFCLRFILSLNFLWENSFFSLRKSFIVNNGFCCNSRVLMLERMHHLCLHKIHQWMIPYSCIMQRARVQSLLHNLWLVERNTQHGLELWGKPYSPRTNRGLLMVLSPYLIISIGVYSFSYSSLDQMWQHGCNLANQFSLTKTSSKYLL